MSGTVGGLVEEVAAVEVDGAFVAGAGVRGGIGGGDGGVSVEEAGPELGSTRMSAQFLNSSKPEPARGSGDRGAPATGAYGTGQLRSAHAQPQKSMLHPRLFRSLL